MPYRYRIEVAGRKAQDKGAGRKAQGYKGAGQI
jgi:hypothetical protein